jgi:hypothetical protein
MKNFRACGVIDTACKIFVFKNRSYLGEFEAELKNALARESGGRGVLFDEKNRGSKISWHCPFKRENVLKMENKLDIYQMK